MFETILGQEAALRLSADIRAGSMAPSMLFVGKEASGKGTTALETFRVLSCTNAAGGAPPDCTCQSCSRHRLLLHQDLLVMGPKSFSAEIAAAEAAFLRELEAPESETYLLFVRAVRKLLLRFSFVLWEDSSNLSKVSPFVTALEESLDALINGYSHSEKPERNIEKLKKTAAAVLKYALKLEDEGLADSIPVSQVRKAGFWLQTKAQGLKKVLIIENADRMQDEARNSLLKVLEEPPANVAIILTSTREELLIPTILSRLRPYRFAARDAALEAQVIQRVFHDAPKENTGLSAYLESFLSVPPARMQHAAAYFAASAAMAAAARLRQRREPISDLLILLGKNSVAAAGDLGRPPASLFEATAKVLKEAESFGTRSLFSRFLDSLVLLVGATVRSCGLAPVQCVPLMELFRKASSEAALAVLVYNQSPALAMDKLGTELARGMESRA
ncbi:DNA polymerase III [Breznakiellaceae bacterium SP9]